MNQSAPNHKRKIKILLADDHQLFREGLKRILNMEEDLRSLANAVTAFRCSNFAIIPFQKSF